MKKKHFTYFQISLMSDIVEDSQIFTSASAVNLLQYIIFEKNKNV